MARRTSDQKSRSRRLFIIISVALAVLLVGTAVWAIAFRGDYTSRTEAFNYSRNIAQDDGRQLSQVSVLPKGGTVRLADVCSEERMDRYGADGQGMDGVGLRVTFTQTSGRRVVSQETLVIPAWHSQDEEPLPTRRALVAQKCRTFTAMAERFTAPVKRSCVMATVVDTTEGMGATLVRRVRETFMDSRAQLAGSTCGSGAFYAYRISENPSQGDRYRVARADLATGMPAAEDWFFASQPASGQSSVLRGLAASLTEIARQQPVDVLRVDVYTDGLENVTDVPDRSVYRDPTLLDPENWAKLDLAWAPTSLKLTGVQVHLHPLPDQGERATALSALAFVYLKDRLERAGATVIIEPL